MTTSGRLAIYGAGGCGREIAWLISKGREGRFPELVSFIEDGTEEGRILNGTPVWSWERFLAQSSGDEQLLVALGDPDARRLIAEKCEAAGRRFATVAHHNVELSDRINLGAGTVVCSGSVLTADIDIGRHVLINIGCTVSHDVKIHDFATLSPGVHIAGHVVVGKSVFVGTGASIINGAPGRPLVIADGTVIAAGACVTADTEPMCLYAGVPAVMKRRYGG